MKTQNFIIESMDFIASRFNEIELSTFYNKSSDTFFIKVSPLTVYESKEFSEVESSIIEDFYAKHFTENICIISDDTPIFVEDVSNFYKMIVEDTHSTFLERKDLDLTESTRSEVSPEIILDYSMAA